MKKYKKSLNKTPLKINTNTTKYIEPIHQIYKEKNIEEEFIYEINPKKKSIINTVNDMDNVVIKKKTLKRKIKSIDKPQSGIIESQNEISESPKKVKKKLVKKKKKVKKEEKHKLENKDIENGIETPTPNGNDEMENFYLIDYQSKINNNKEEMITPEAEDNYHTFHECELREQSPSNDNIDTTNVNNEQQNENNNIITTRSQNTNTNEEFKLTIYSNPANNLPNTDNYLKDKVKEENDREQSTLDNDINRHGKMKKIKFREKNDRKGFFNISKEKDRKNDNKYDVENESKPVSEKEYVKKKKKVLTKRRLNMK